MNKFTLPMLDKFKIINEEIGSIYILQKILEDSLAYNQEKCIHCCRHNLLLKIILEHTKNIIELF